MRSIVAQLTCQNNWESKKFGPGWYSATILTLATVIWRFLQDYKARGARLRDLRDSAGLSARHEAMAPPRLQRPASAGVATSATRPPDGRTIDNLSELCSGRSRAGSPTDCCNIEITFDITEPASGEFRRGICAPCVWACEGVGVGLIQHPQTRT